MGVCGSFAHAVKPLTAKFAKGPPRTQSLHQHSRLCSLSWRLFSRGKILYTYRALSQEPCKELPFELIPAPHCDRIRDCTRDTVLFPDLNPGKPKRKTLTKARKNRKEARDTGVRGEKRRNDPRDFQRPPVSAARPGQRLRTGHRVCGESQESRRVLRGRRLGR